MLVLTELKLRFIIGRCLEISRKHMIQLQNLGLACSMFLESNIPKSYANVIIYFHYSLEHESGQR